MNTLYKIYIFFQKTRIYKILRGIIVGVFTAALLIYSLLYVALSLTPFQDVVKEIGETELSKLLQSDVKIESVNIEPFNQLSAKNVSITVADNDTVLKIDKLGAGISLYQLVLKQRFVFTYAEIIGLDAKVNKATPDGDFNIQPIINALSKKDENKEPSKFDIKIYNIVLRKSNLCYDILSEPYLDSKFDNNHIKISNLKADIVLPRLKNEDFLVHIKRLALREKCGFELKTLALNAAVNDSIIKLDKFVLELPNSHFEPKTAYIHINSLKNIKSGLGNKPFEFNVSDSYITPADFAGFVPALRNLRHRFNIDIAANGTVNNIDIQSVKIAETNNGFLTDITGEIKYVLTSDSLRYHFPHIRVAAEEKEISVITSTLEKMSDKAKQIVRNCGDVNVGGYLSGSKYDLTYRGSVKTSAGEIDIKTSLKNDTARRTKNVKAEIVSPTVNIGKIISKPEIIADAGFNLKVNGYHSRRGITGEASGTISHATVKGYSYKDINLSVIADKNLFTGNLNVNDANAKLALQGNVNVDGDNSFLEMNAAVKDINLATLNLVPKYPDNILSFNLSTDIQGIDIDNATGLISLTDIKFIDKGNKGIQIDKFHLLAEKDETMQYISIRSDILNAELSGLYTFKDLVPSLKAIVQKAVPDAFPNKEPFEQFANNDFDFDIRIKENHQFSDFFKLPVKLHSPVDISGNINTIAEDCNVKIKVPYIQQKNKIIENSSVNLSLAGNNPKCTFGLSTVFPSKRGPVALKADIAAANNNIDTGVNWDIYSDRKFNGDVKISTDIFRDTENNVSAIASFKPTEVVVNDTTWNVYPSSVSYINNVVTVNKFEASSNRQFIKINGAASMNKEDILTVDLSQISLDFIFEALDIPNVTFGGIATGKFYASNLFTKIPSLLTNNLHVDNFAYNKTVLGNTDIKSSWNNETQGIDLNADILQSNGLLSFVDGSIFPTRDSLYLDFDVHKTNVRFLLPFMQAFSSDLSGVVSGKGTLFGNFHTINFMGDVFAEDLNIKIDYLNTTYHCTDSVHLKPDYISLDGITIMDKFGHKANLGGYIAHNAFHDPKFRIGITNAQNLLCYDTNKHNNPVWYGTIFGNGSAFINGEPGTLDIDVTMTSAPNSKFTFVLSDAEAAGDYKFITVIDRNKSKTAEKDSIPEAVKIIKENFNKQSSGTPTDLKINLHTEITPDIQMTLVMDPEGGDKIRATGSGNMRIEYKTVDDVMTMHGNYTLEKGAYNFTLQDIIIKDFIIDQGSKISFNGDPMKAVLDIAAKYQLNASLTDLDESFALDKELNRTNVPVQAVLYVKGDMSQPDISFDLAFPTLTQDAYRKVKSIVSTEDMMNRQILYLIALNKFYTPEYMGNSTTNNEFANVASSTISSQLSRILGQISDKVSISPNFRTNKGDFSDVEVDVALSSQLLNNRLLLNGNFGYRDNSMNANSSNFIGDFDIEYLLTRNGNIRLKAYNHYNDQNYYVKSALTTQGVGIVFKYDFDKPLDFLHKKRNKYILTPEK